MTLQHMSEDEFIELRDREGIDDDTLIERMLAEGWEHGSAPDGWNEWWREDDDE